MSIKNADDAAVRLPDWTLDAVDTDKMKVLALLLADPNAIHYDPDAAVALGIADRQVNQGPSNMAMVANAVRAAYPDGTLRMLAVRLKGSVLAGQRIRVSGHVVDHRRADDIDYIRCELELYADEGPAVLTAVAEVEVMGTATPIASTAPNTRQWPPNTDKRVPRAPSQSGSSGTRDEPITLPCGPDCGPGRVDRG